MNKNHSFTIYNASAGSGKTYTLVKEYLKILLKSSNLETFKRILAITFTNKAVAEMKERIIETLQKFSNISILDKPDSMFHSICEALQMEPIDLHTKSNKLLNTIIHNYAAFDISTIDGFTHKLIRTFAYDLKLPLNFEVELDQEGLLNEAVNSLIEKAGTDEALTKLLIDFAIEKADEDKSWDVSFDFNNIAKLLVNENDIPFIEALKDKTLEDFKTLKGQLKKDVLGLEDLVTKKAQDILALIDASGLEFNDFSGSYLPKYFKNLVDKKFDLNFSAKWQEDLETKVLCPKRVTDAIASVIEQIQPQLADGFYRTKAQVFQLKFLKAFYKNITPLSVLNVINKELTALKEEQNKMLISEFNSIISKEIKNQPTPFIYERIGEKFNHYFIDEFQDTSVMQWENLIPLLGNSLSSETGTVMLVGDAKQAIYRWRGGKAEQFIGLFNDENPFYVEKQIENLPTNYRSNRSVVEFNNGFFNHLSSEVFGEPIYRNLYEEAHQNTCLDGAGYVALSFLDFDKEDDRDELYSEHVLRTIRGCLDNGFKFEDICVLVRKKREGVSVAHYLSQHDVPIVSSETLLIGNSPEVNFINHVLRLLIQPKNDEVKIEILNYLTTLFKVEDKHDFFAKHKGLSIEMLFEELEIFNVFVDGGQLLQLPLYDLAETIVRGFNLIESSNAYVQFYLDIVLDFTQKKGSDISRFLEYFDKKKGSLSIVSPKGQNAVQIMTIHKSKGLEFPVVVFPYADLDIYRELDPKEWFKIDEAKYAGFSHTLLNYSKDFENYGAVGQQIYANHQSELELDNINLLYVALTRAVEQLYVISKKDMSSKGIANNKRYSGLLINYLQHLGLWNDTQSVYAFGESVKISEDLGTTKETAFQQEFISTAKETLNIKVVTKSGLLWDTNQQEAIEKGNLIHNMMALVKTKEDIDFVINDFLRMSLITNEQTNELKQTIVKIVEHPKLIAYFNSEYTIYNERDIITKEGIILRPDRLVINSNREAVIIDYKTGAEDKTHWQQLQSYQDVLEEMKISVVKKTLVYIDEIIRVKEL